MFSIGITSCWIGSLIIMCYPTYLWSFSLFYSSTFLWSYHNYFSLILTVVNMLILSPPPLFLTELKECPSHHRWGQDSGNIFFLENKAFSWNRLWSYFMKVLLPLTSMMSMSFQSRKGVLLGFLNHEILSESPRDNTCESLVHSLGLQTSEIHSQANLHSASSNFLFIYIVFINLPFHQLVLKGSRSWLYFSVMLNLPEIR